MLEISQHRTDRVDRLGCDRVQHESPDRERLVLRIASVAGHPANIGLSPYSMQDSYGVSRARFEIFTLGTLAIIVLIAVIGYALGAPVRNQSATQGDSAPHAVPGPHPASP